MKVKYATSFNTGNIREPQRSQRSKKLSRDPYLSKYIQLVTIPPRRQAQSVTSGPAWPLWSLFDLKV